MIDWSASFWLEYGSVNCQSVDGIEKTSTTNLKAPREMTFEAASAMMDYWRRTAENGYDDFGGLSIGFRVATP